MLFERRTEAGVKRARAHHWLRSCRGLHGTGVEIAVSLTDRPHAIVCRPSVWVGLRGR